MAFIVLIAVLEKEATDSPDAMKEEHFINENGFLRRGPKNPMAHFLLFRGCNKIFGTLINKMDEMNKNNSFADSFAVIYFISFIIVPAFFGFVIGS